MRVDIPTLVSLLILVTPASRAYDSGSTGADGALCVGLKARSPDGQSCVDSDTPTSNPYVVTLPPSGVLNYTTVFIGPGYTLKFARNAANTPVYLLASGDIENRGIIDVSGEPATCGYGSTYGIAYAPAQAADLVCWGGLGGPGGEAGGSIGPAGPSAGLGVGGSFDGVTAGNGGMFGGAIGETDPAELCAGAGGAGPTRQGQFGGCRDGVTCTLGGAQWARPGWKLDHGGAGGGAAFMYWGADPNPFYDVGAGGGGGGALIIASSTAIRLAGGHLYARGADRGASGGGGGGGLIRLVAPTVTSKLGETQPGALIDASSCGQGASWWLGASAFCTPAVDQTAACGAPGLIEIESYDESNLLLTAYPASEVYRAAPRRALPWGDDQAQRPTLVVAAIQGRDVPALQTTTHPHRHPMVTIPTGFDLSVDVEARYVPLDAAVYVGVNTVGRGRQIYTTTLQPGGSPEASVWRATINVPDGTRVGDVQAWVAQITVPE